MLTVGRLAEKAGLNPGTVRYYERLGLLPAPRRQPSGYRFYEGDDVRRLVFIQRAKALGFTLSEIRELLALHADPAGDCGIIRVRAQAKLANIDAKIADMERMREALRELASYCPGQGRPIEDCSIFAHFFDEKTVDAPEK